MTQMRDRRAWLLAVNENPGEECIEHGLVAPYGNLRFPDRFEKFHVFVCRAFHGEKPGKADEVRHLCGNAWCVNRLHIAWGTYAEQAEDKRQHGTINRGERNGQSKLTESDVATIRERCDAGDRQRDVAVDFGVSQQTISKIVRREKWA